jgi:hypothetical protein
LALGLWPACAAVWPALSLAGLDSIKPEKQKNKKHVMKSKKIPFILYLAGATTLAFSASAQVTLSGTELAPSPGVTYEAYNQSPGGFGAVPATATFSSGVVDLSELTYPGTGGLSYWASVTVANGFDGVSLGTLNSFISSGSTFDLHSLTGSFANGNFGNNIISAYWVVTLDDPHGGTATYTSAADGVLGANTFDQLTSGNPGGSTTPSPLDYYTGTGLDGSLAAGQQINPNNVDTWADLAATEGTWTVASVGVEIGNWSELYPLDADIDSFTLGGSAGVPDTASTLSLLGICFGAMAGMRRRLHRA